MHAEPRYNDIYYKRTTAHSQILDIVQGKICTLKDMPTPMDLQSLFENTNPIEIEIGFGKGRFLLEASKQYPHTNFIGIERAQKYVELTRQRFQKYIRHHAIDNKVGANFENVRLAWTDANYLLSRYVPDKSINAYHIYFPDPWPKARQQKRRIFRNNAFLDAIARTISTDGQVSIATDHAPYYHEILCRVAKRTDFVPISQNSNAYQHIATNFEIKYRLAGRKIYRVVYAQKKEQWI